MIRRFLAAGIAAAAITAVAVVSPATPTAAAVVQYEELAGNFVGDERDEGYTYQAGSALDGIVTFDNGGVSGGDLSIDFHADIQVGGTYDPIVGNFDGDPYDEIIWYSPGSGRDYLWSFTSLTTVESTPLTIGGTYEPVAGDFTGDGVDDVLWYAPGTAGDHLWEYNPDGRHVSSPLTINSRYTPLAASIGSDATDDVFWYSPGTATDYVWDFVVGTTSYTSSSPYRVDGRYEPFVLDVFNDGWRGEDIFWYAPGTRTDYLWDFLGGQSYQYTETVNGDYHSTPTGDFFGDGLDDILWIGSSAGYLWDHAPSSTNPAFVDRWIYDVYAAASTANSADTASDDVGPTAAEASGTPIPATPGGTLPTRP